MRPSIALAMISKNEAHNFPALFDSIKGCFDKIYLTDTGSTDGTVEVARQCADKIGTPIEINHFEWIKDFAAARNASFAPVTEDFIMWMDGDDAMRNPAAFILWRDTAMEFADMHLATYDYACDPEGKALVSFLRERVIRRSINPKWNYFIHEGVIPPPNTRMNTAITWRVQHRRSPEDLAKDRGRNLSYFEGRMDTLDARMKFYYGKELFENQRTAEALSAFKDVLTRQDLELHDRILGFQYAAYSASTEGDKIVVDNSNPNSPETQKTVQEKMNFYAQAIGLAHAGSQLDPCRAEFHSLIGDCYLKQNRLKEALPWFAAAHHCLAQHAGGVGQGALFTYQGQYTDYPLIQKAKIYFNLGMIQEAEETAKECAAKFDNPEAKKMLSDLETMRPMIDTSLPREKVEDIVFTTPPTGAYEFDEELYKTKGMGGSETALIMMAKHLKQKTGRNVLVFAPREKDLTCESGVHYISNKKANDYFKTFEPKIHIAWRHNIKLTNAYTVSWVHDLWLPTAEHVQNFDKCLALTPFHKNFLVSSQGIPEEKVLLTRNGIPTEKFKFERKPKDPNKTVWLSSPDRGLERTILVMDRARKEFPDLTLHVFYGLENLHKYGLSDLAHKLKAMMDERPWIVYRGFVEQSTMQQEVSDATVWLHCCNFIESFCITALETLANGIYPVTRRLGALQNTLAEAESQGMATMLDFDCDTEEHYQAYANAYLDVLRNKKWENIKNLDISKWDWERVSEEWIAEFKL